MQKTLGRRERRLASVTWLLPSVLLGACSTVLGLERSSREHDLDGGAAGTLGEVPGTAGSGGEARGGASGETGVAGEGAGSGSGGAGEGGRNAGAEGGTGLTSGAAGGGSGGVGESDAGGNGGADAGAGGKSPDPRSVIGAACDRDGDFACHANNPFVSLVCREGSWNLRTTCRGDQICDSADGECDLIEYPCDGPVTRCRERWLLYDCAANAIDPKVVFCPFGCEDGACLPASGDELIVHYPPYADTTELGMPWPRPIPICFRSQADNVALAGVIRDEAERSWGRLLDIDFSGWSECTDSTEAPRIEFEFLEDCRSHLGGDVPRGKASDGGSARIAICRTYRDASDALQDMTEHEQLLRFVTRHQLGHALGWEDDGNQDARPTALAPALDESEAESLVLTGALLRRYRFSTPYGHKPSKTLVTTNGACLSSNKSGLTLTLCSKAGSGRFELDGEQVKSLLAVAPGCIGATLEDPVARLEPCESQPITSRFSMQRVRWSTPERCVMPATAAIGSPLVTAPCAPVGDASQAWNFEIVGQRQQGSTIVRLHFGAVGHCLAIAEGTANDYDVPVLEACDETLYGRHLFQIWPNGEISIGEGVPGGQNSLCLQWDAPESVLYFESCTYDEFWFSGPLETATGLALTHIVNEGLTEVRAQHLGLGELPADNQIFDYAF